MPTTSACSESAARFHWKARIVRLEQADDRQRAAVAAHLDREVAADRQAEVARRRGGDQRRPGASDEIGRARERIAATRLAAIVTAEIRPEVAVNERIDAKEM